MSISEEGAGGGGVMAAPLFSPWEAEQRIENLAEFDVSDVGKSMWMKQHEALEQLNLQAHQSAQQQGDEFVMEAFLTFDKMRLLVHELLVIEAWRMHVFPRIKKSLVEAKATMRGYFCLYHEATLVNLLCVFMHHTHATESLGEAAVDLVDYLARRLVELNAKGRQWSSRTEQTLEKASDAPQSAADLDPLADLEKQAEDVLFQASVGCTTLTRYLCEHMNALPLSVLTRATDTHDLLCCVVPLIENPPWTRRTDSGEWQKLVENKWVTYQPADLLTLTKTEGQLWLALFQIVCNNEVRKRYHFNSFRKNQLLRARKYINEVLLDQLPVLADVQRFMDELAITEVPEPTAQQGGSSVLIVEQVSMAQEKLVKHRDWAAIAAAQIKEVFGAQTDATDADLRRLVDNVYAMDGVEEILGETPTAELYSQELSTLTVTPIVTGAQTPVPFTFTLEYTRTGSVKPMATQYGPFLRQKWAPEERRELDLSAAQAQAVAAHDASVQAAGEAGKENDGSQLPVPPLMDVGSMAVLFKADVAFIGTTPFQTALVSDAVRRNPRLPAS